MQHQQNPQNNQAKSKVKKQSRSSLLQKPVEYIARNQLNSSLAKMQYTFSKADRFDNSVNSVTPNKYYQLPQILRTQRSASFGYGNKTQFGKSNAWTPAPGKYQVARQFESESIKGSTMGLSRQEIKFNNLFNSRLGNAQFPQPATYNVNIANKSPKYSIGERFCYKKKWIDFVPGPGNYNHIEPTSKLQSQVSNFKTTPTTKFGRTQRLKQIFSTSMITPGPGNYNSNTTTMKKLGTRFSKDSRQKSISHEKVIMPGPGTYKVFSQFLH